MLELTWVHLVALSVGAIAAVVGGRLLGGLIHRVLYRKLLLERTAADDRFLLRLGGPFELGGIVLAWQVLVSFMDLPPSVNAFARGVGDAGLLLVLGWAATRTIDTSVERIATRSTWIAEQRVSRSLLPLAQRAAKIVVGILVAVMLFARMGYATGPLLVVLAIVGGCVALAAYRPLENVIAAYAILGDHGIREGDIVTLENGVRGTIEQIGLYSTRLRTTSSAHVILPNRKLADAQLERSFQRPQTRPLGVVSTSGGK
jgi:small-conductance mechanosensitive channel